MSDAQTPAKPSSSVRPVWLRILLGLVGGVAALVLIGAIGIVVGLAVASHNLPDLEAIADYQPKLPLRVYSAEGELLGEFGDERRQFMPIAQIPKVMQNAVLAIEDARFYEHGGVDYWGVLRAGLAQFGSVGSQGASTITMQVARNFYLSTEKTLTRKLYEVLLALKIEHALTKEQILELYMNQIFLGQRAHGFAAASEIYFGKPLQQVSIAEAAMLAGLPKAPSAYNPIANPRRATIRQQYIIDRMLDNRFITPAEHATAKAEVLSYRRQTTLPYHGEYVAEMARQMIYNQYGDETYTRGLQVQLTVRAKEQLAAYRALRKGLMDYELRQVYRGPEGHVDLPADPALLDARIAEALADHPDNDDLRAAVVLEAGPRKVVVALQSGEQLTIQGDGLKPVTSGLAANAAAGRQIRRGSVVRAMRVGKDWALTQLPEVEGALVAMQPETGAIAAMVGGFDFGRNKFNHATQAWRQPGSAFKPFIYSAALEKGFGPATIVNDGPLFFSAGATGSQPWEPKNYDGKFEGPMPLRRALAKSKNMVSIRVLQAIGVGYGRDWVTRFGFDRERHEPYLTMALGAGSVTPMQMAVGYSVFANGGYRMAPVLIARVTDTQGKLLYETQLAAPTEAQRAIDARNAFIMDSLLQEVARSGTAARAQATLKRPDLYGKTGTTNDAMDAWFVGFGPSRVAAVWIGYDNPRKLGDRETGGGLSLPVWIDYMGTALAGVPVAEKTAPPGVAQVGDWYYEEYAHGEGVQSIVEETLPAANVPPPPTDAEKKSILDLFR
ncbi:MAG: penicillin-binding protein 1A [Proteobacteria bacterium]|nr:penicillin-binding protein 1A [Pseudomonadota bacterium]